MATAGVGVEVGRRLAASLATVLFAACARVPPEDLSRDPAALLLEVRAAQARVAGVRGTARVRVDSNRFKGSLVEFIAAERPDHLRLETLDFFGNPVAVMVSTGGRFAYLDEKANVFYRGLATPHNLSALVPLALPVEDLVTILCGSAPLLSAEAREVGVEGELLGLTLGDGDEVEHLLVGEGASVVRSRLRRLGPLPSGEEASYALAFGQFRERAGTRFPGELTLEADGGRPKIEVRWRDDLEVSPPVDRALFALEPPRGARTVDLQDGELPAEGPWPEPPRE
jgi:hypothetical protein